MSKYNGEKVLVVPRPVFEQAGYFQGVTADADKYLDHILQPGTASFIDREQAENDPSHKQLIAYGIFRHNGKILHYTRGNSGGETRLHDKGSLGIGGHINPVDLQGRDPDLQTYMSGVEREVTEELHLQTAYTQRVIGIINDDGNEVGAVHLGVIHLFDLETDQVAAREDAIANIRFLTVEELCDTPLYDKLETWSQIALELLK